MTPAIEFTSVPPWAVAPRRAPADLSGRYWTVVAFAGGEPIATEWVAQLKGRHPESAPACTWCPTISRRHARSTPTWPPHASGGG